MSKFKKYALLLFVVLFLGWFLAYLCISFVSLEINPLKWEHSERFSYVFCVLCVFMCSFPILSMVEFHSDEF